VQERLRRAELERSAAQVKAREERKRRKLAVALALAVLALLSCVGLGVLWWQHDRAEAARLQAEGARQEAELLLATQTAREKEAEREAELRAAVGAALDKAAALQQQARWA